MTQLTTKDCLDTAKMFFDSKLFGTATVSQLFVIIQAGIEIGIQPYQSCSGIQIIQNKSVFSAGMISAQIGKSDKYDYSVIEHNNNVCSIDFFRDSDKIGNSTFTIEDAKKAGTKNIDRYPKNMLFARAISNGAKWYCPDVFGTPVYTPEDFNVSYADKEAESKENFNEDEIIVILNACETLEQLKDSFILLVKEYPSNKIQISDIKDVCKNNLERKVKSSKSSKYLSEVEPLISFSKSVEELEIHHNSYKNYLNPSDLEVFEGMVKMKRNEFK